MLTDQDVQLLLSDPSAENRASAAAKVASEFGTGSLSESERMIAEDIFKVMVRDAEERVRLALSAHLKSAANVPNDIAKSLATDIADDVAMPMLQFSDALTDADLVEIVRTQPAVRTKAVAERDAVSTAVSEAIVDHGGEDAVVALVTNHGAEIAEESLSKVVDAYGDSERVQTPLIARPTLPVIVAERLLVKVTDHLKDQLIQKHALSEETATDLVLQSREKATLGLSDGDAAISLVWQLHKNGRLTPSIVLRALCMGDLMFFEAALAHLSDIPVENARVLIHDEGDLGFRSLYQKAQMPASLLPAYRSALDMNRNAELERTDEDPEHRMRKLLERVLTEHEEIVDEFGADNVDYLLAKFSRMGQAA